MVISIEQLQERVNYLGGSDAAKILGRSKWGTPLSTFMSKVHPKHDESENCIGGKNEASYWGNELEDKVAEAFTKVTGKKVHRVNETIVHPEYPFIRANIDRRVVGEDAILECKTCSAYKAQEWEGDEVPEEYILQVMHYLAVTGKEKGYVAVLIGGQKFVWKEILRDESIINIIIDAEVNFWNNFVLTGNPPMTTGSDKDSEILEELYPDSQPETIMNLSPNVGLIATQREAIVAEIKALEVKKTEIENRVMAEMMDTETAIAGPIKITWKTQTSERLDSKKLKEIHPLLWDQFKYESKSRVLRFGKVKKGKE